MLIADISNPYNIKAVSETFEKCSILFKFKEDEDFNRPDKKRRDRQAYIEYSEV